MIYINAVGLISALGAGIEETAQGMRSLHASGFKMDEGRLVGKRKTWVGAVNSPLIPMKNLKKCYQSRNNQVMITSIEQIRFQIEKAICQYGAERIGVVLGTSTSGLDESYQALHADQHDERMDAYCYEQQELGNLARAVSDYFGLFGPSYTVSTACSSSARAMISAASLLDSGLVDAVITGGADTLNPVTINGFDSLSVLSTEPCAPFAQERSGINIGEGAAVFLFTKEKCKQEARQIFFMGGGESSDAWHMSAPHPEGVHAKKAILQALRNADIQAEDIGYIALHGTGTKLNDEVEAQIIHDIFGHKVPCSSIKHLTGHTLGAAGAISAAIAYILLSVDERLLPPQDFLKSVYDEWLPPFGLITEPTPLKKKIVLCNAFAFGGNNACLLLGIK